jgi:hypothetical protein
MLILLKQTNFVPRDKAPGYGQRSHRRLAGKAVGFLAAVQQRVRNNGFEFVLLK